jgi:hypothetical protein
MYAKFFRNAKVLLGNLDYQPGLDGCFGDFLDIYHTYKCRNILQSKVPFLASGV